MVGATQFLTQIDFTKTFEIKYAIKYQDLIRYQFTNYMYILEGLLISSQFIKQITVTIRQFITNASISGGFLSTELIWVMQNDAKLNKNKSEMQQWTLKRLRCCLGWISQSAMINRILTYNV